MDFNRERIREFVWLVKWCVRFVLISNYHYRNDFNQS